MSLVGTDQSMATSRGLCLLVTFCGLLLLTCYPPCSDASRFSRDYKRALLALESNKPQVIRAELIHRDHPDSPLSFAREATDLVSRRLISRRLGAGVEFTSPISSQPDVSQAYNAEYVMTLYLGTPAKKFVVIVDTGSNLVWVQCKPCNSPYQCYNTTLDPVFNPSASSSYSSVSCSDNSTCAPVVLQLDSDSDPCDAQRHCHISSGYGTGGSQIAGTLSTETIAFSNTSEGRLGISNFTFGCMNNDTASFGYVDGIAGFGRGSVSLPSQLSNLTSFNAFSYCLVPFYLSTNLTSPLMFGASNLNGLELVYTPLVMTAYTDSSPYYYANMTSISVNGTALSIPQASFQINLTTDNGGTIFDSGTPQLLLLEDIYTPVLQSIQKIMTYPVVTESDGKGNNFTCYNISGVQQPEYPSMTLHFSDVNGTTVDFQLTGENLFFPGEESDVQCLAVFGQTDPYGTPNIIGNIAQANHYIAYDLVNMRIGWTPKDCSVPI